MGWKCAMCRSPAGISQIPTWGVRRHACFTHRFANLGGFKFQRILYFYPEIFLGQNPLVLAQNPIWIWDAELDQSSTKTRCAGRRVWFESQIQILFVNPTFTWWFLFSPPAVHQKSCENFHFEAVGLHNMPLLEVLEVAGFVMLQFVRIVLFHKYESIGGKPRRAIYYYHKIVSILFFASPLKKN